MITTTRGEASHSPAGTGPSGQVVSRLASLTGVIPARNEEGNIELAVRELANELSRVADRVEVVVVDDGSEDGTGARLSALRGEIPELTVIHHAHSRGYGASLRAGFAAATSEWLFFTDADRQFEVSEIRNLVALSADHDVVAGFRAARQDPPHRRLMAAGWNRMVAATLGVHLRDVNCAFKLLRADLVQRLSLHGTGSVFGAELALELERAGARIAQVPVTHRARSWGRQTGGDLAVVTVALREYWRLRTRALS